MVLLRISVEDSTPWHDVRHKKCLPWELQIFSNIQQYSYAFSL